MPSPGPPPAPLVGLPRPLAKLASFGPELLGGVPKLQQARGPQTVATPPVRVSTPARPAVAPAPAEAPIATITAWSEADITPDPTPAAPAGQAKPSKLGRPLGGFRSRRQWRWAFASKKPWARTKAHRTKGGPKVRYRVLPERKA